MLQTAIIGGGLCGLVLARRLTASGQDCVIFEARERLGGRVLTKRSERTGLAMDLGATWYWPSMQPRISRLVAELGLAAFPQHDPGDYLDLSDFDRAPEAREQRELHGSAYRVSGGMNTLIECLNGALPEGIVQLGRALSVVIDRGDHVLLKFESGREVEARRVVLAMPPRLVEERIRFEPELHVELRAAMRATPTRMASQAKAVAGFEEAFWRKAGQSGNAFVRHEHVVLSEVSDACDAEGRRAALCGFFALPVSARTAFKEGMPMLVSSQLVQLFGVDADHGEIQWQDWAEEAFTSSSRDLDVDTGEYIYGDPALQVARWGGRLHFGGSETAIYGAGYLEGALASAARLQYAIQADRPILRGATSLPSPTIEASIRVFGHWVSERRSELAERFARAHGQLPESLHSARVLQGAALITMDTVYGEALDFLADVFATSATVPANGASLVASDLLASFRGFNKAVLDEAIAFERAESWPGSHKEPVLNGEVLRAVAGDLALVWREFAACVETLLSSWFETPFESRQCA